MRECARHWGQCWCQIFMRECAGHGGENVPDMGVNDGAICITSSLVNDKATMPCVLLKEQSEPRHEKTGFLR